MKHIDTTDSRMLFECLMNSPSVQAAMMVLGPGQSSSRQVENEHPQSEQWVFVISGAGTADFAKRSIKLKRGSLLLIAKNERHKITNTGRGQMRTLNFYSPPAYTAQGNVRRSVKK